MKHFRRSFVAWVALLGVLFSQLAVAAYACPGTDAMSRIVAAASADEMPDCHKGAGSEQLGALCLAHCQQGDQSVDRLAVAVFAAAIPAGFVPLRLHTVSAGRDAPAVQPSILEHPTEPPAAVRHCRFLI